MVVETVVEAAVNDLRGCSGAGRDGIVRGCMFEVGVFAGLIAGDVFDS